MLKLSLSIVDSDIKELTLEGGLGSQDCCLGMDPKEDESVDAEELRTSD